MRSGLQIWFRCWGVEFQLLVCLHVTRVGIRVLFWNDYYGGLRVNIKTTIKMIPNSNRDTIVRSILTDVPTGSSKELPSVRS